LFLGISGDIFFSFFENFHFWAQGPLFGRKLTRKPTGQPREPKYLLKKTIKIMGRGDELENYLQI